jgi:hypothetical protein
VFLYSDIRNGMAGDCMLCRASLLARRLSGCSVNGMEWNGMVWADFLIAFVRKGAAVGRWKGMEVVDHWASSVS